MKRKLLVVLAVFTVLTATAAAPASAKGTIRGLSGDVDITLYLTECTNEEAPGPLLTWAGTVDFGTRTLGIAYFPTADLEVIGDEGWVYFEEVWTLFRLPNRTLTDANLIRAACNPNRVLLEGIDRGFGTPGGTAFAAGVVMSGRGQFEKFIGGMSLWVGEYTSAGMDEFASKLWLFRGGVL